MDDGTVVRDHRSNPTEPVATNPLPPGQRTLASSIAADVYQQLASRVATCATKVPPAARGAEPFVYVNLTVAIAGGTLTATDVVPVPHDIAPPANDALVACIRDSITTVRAAAKGEPDRTGYVLQYPIRIR